MPKLLLENEYTTNAKYLEFQQNVCETQLVKATSDPLHLAHRLKSGWQVACKVYIEHCIHLTSLAKLLWTQFNENLVNQHQPLTQLAVER